MEPSIRGDIEIVPFEGAEVVYLELAFRSSGASGRTYEDHEHTRPWIRPLSSEDADGRGGRRVSTALASGQVRAPVV